jgi:hypothetical protein
MGNKVETIVDCKILNVSSSGHHASPQLRNIKTGSRNGVHHQKTKVNEDEINLR